MINDWSNIHPFLFLFQYQTKQKNQTKETGVGVTNWGPLAQTIRQKKIISETSEWWKCLMLFLEDQNTVKSSKGQLVQFQTRPRITVQRYNTA